MSQPIISVSHVSKKYRLGQIGMTSLRDDLHRLSIWAKSFGNKSTATSDQRKEFWALRDVSFDVQQGEVVGIIGRNGAGKSTLLKILSRITEPSTGEVRLRGRVGSLLEVGTGFHPELSGRDNVFLNGAILGMTKAEIARKFDEIVAFAEVEKFIDTPVKRYSSGMYVRLAFAIAAHLEPEILIVDEVLAVGDSNFQRKCIAKMQQVSRADGRTILFVSHSMETILRLCSRAILLDAGTVAAVGPTHTITPLYYQNSDIVLLPGTAMDLTTRARSGNGNATFTSIEYRIIDGKYDNFVYSGTSLEFKVELHAKKRTRIDGLALYFENLDGIKILNYDIQRERPEFLLEEGTHIYTVKTGPLLLNPCTLQVSLWMADVSNSQQIDDVKAFCKIDLLNPPGQTYNTNSSRDGVISTMSAGIELR